MHLFVNIGYKNPPFTVFLIRFIIVETQPNNFYFGNEQELNPYK